MGNFTLLDLFSILVVVEVWVVNFQNRRFCFYSNNQSMVHAIKYVTTNFSPIVACLHLLVLQCLELNIYKSHLYVPGVQNKIADHLISFLVPQVSCSGF